MPNHNQDITYAVLALNLVLASSCLTAAEIRGTVNVQQTGLFSARSDGLKNFPVSVALYPGEGQAVPRHTSLRHSIVLNTQIQPMYLAISRGDSLRFENQNNVYHELFTHSHSQPLVVQLDREGLGSEKSVTLNDVADLHWFCRIHAKSYLRIDVVDTPLVRVIQAGDSFEFRDLPTGKWRLRIAAPGAETKTLVTEAVTAPPPLQVQMTVKGFGQGGVGAASPRAASIEQLFPSQPGI
jgi:hypothetical protein